jgi:hypothetical protein
MQKQSMQQKEDALSGVVGWDQTSSLFYFMLLKKLYLFVFVIFIFVWRVQF